MRHCLLWVSSITCWSALRDEETSAILLQGGENRSVISNKPKLPARKDRNLKFFVPFLVKYFGNFALKKTHLDGCNCFVRLYE
jgi:hypothetical protein